MPTTPLITFKAGKCACDTSATPWKVTSEPTPGYIYLYIGEADELVHFCWRPRTAPVSEPELDLLMIPGDGSFFPYTGGKPSSSSDEVKSPINGRIYTLKFFSSSQRHFFWLQSKSQHPSGDPSWFSPRDLKLGHIVELLISGEDVDVSGELQEIQNTEGPERRDDDGDEPMEDVEGTGGSRLRSGSTGGAGPDATGGDIREEGEESREGGADGGRAAPMPNDASAVVQRFLASLQQGGKGSAAAQTQQADTPFTTLPDLLPSSITIPIIDSAAPILIDSLLSHLPPTILLLAQEADDLSDVDPNSETVQAAIQALSLEQKKDILKRVLRSPQLHQSLGSLTVALRDGGLPTVSEALKIEVENGGYVRNGGVPLGGGQAVEAFLEGVKRTVEKEEKEEKGGEGQGEGKMDTS